MTTGQTRYPIPDSGRDLARRTGLGTGVAVIAVWLGVFVTNFVLGFVLGDIPFIGFLLGLVSLLITPVVALVMFAAWAFLTYKAYKGDRYRIPVLGSLAN